MALKRKTSADPFVGKRPIAEQKNPAYKHRISNQTLFKIHTFCCFEIKFDHKYRLNLHFTAIKKNPFCEFEFNFYKKV
jgi:hypothetical protein